MRTCYRPRTICKRNLVKSEMQISESPGLACRTTVSADGQVRVFDIERALSFSSIAREREFRTSETCIRKFRCHRRRTKRIVTEESSDVFLTVAEVIWHLDIFNWSDLMQISLLRMVRFDNTTYGLPTDAVVNVQHRWLNFPLTCLHFHCLLWHHIILQSQEHLPT